MFKYMPKWMKPRKVKEAERVREDMEKVQAAFRSGTEKIQAALAKKEERRSD